MSFIDKILGNTAQSQLKKLQPMVDKINALEGDPRPVGRGAAE